MCSKITDERAHMLLSLCCRAQGAPFVLNTSDFPATITDRRVPMDQNAAVPDEVLDRFAEGFEPRRDVIAGQLVSIACCAAL